MRTGQPSTRYHTYSYIGHEGDPKAGHWALGSGARIVIFVVFLELTLSSDTAVTNGWLFLPLDSGSSWHWTGMQESQIFKKLHYPED